MPNSSDTERKLQIPSIEVGFGTKAGLAGAAGQAVAAIVLAAESKDPTSIVFAAGAAITLLTVVSARFAQFLAIAKKILDAVDTDPPAAVEFRDTAEKKATKEADDSNLELVEGSPLGRDAVPSGVDSDVEAL